MMTTEGQPSQGNIQDSKLTDDITISIKVYLQVEEKKKGGIGLRAVLIIRQDAYGPLKMHFFNFCFSGSETPLESRITG